jgi:hypothetical protein
MKIAMVKITGKGAKVGTFFKAETGGQILADGVEIEGVEIGRLADANTGGRISARNAKVQGQVHQAATARAKGTINLSNTVIRNVGGRVSHIDPEELARRLTESLGEEVSAESASKIIEAFKDAKDIQVVEKRAKESGVWKTMDRVGGFLGILEALKSLFG